MISNRADRRKFHKAWKKKFGLGSWQDYNETCVKQMPIINMSKRIFYHKPTVYEDNGSSRLI